MATTPRTKKSAGEAVNVAGVDATASATASTLDTVPENAFADAPTGKAGDIVTIEMRDGTLLNVTRKGFHDEYEDDGAKIVDENPVTIEKMRENGVEDSPEPGDE